MPKHRSETYFHFRIRRYQAIEPAVTEMQKHFDTGIEGRAIFAQVIVGKNGTLSLQGDILSASKTRQIAKIIGTKDKFD